MTEYKIQKKDTNCSWGFQSPTYIFYTTRERAQQVIDEEIKSWQKQKNLVHPMYPMSVIKHFSNPDNWRVVQREVTEWEPAS